MVIENMEILTAETEPGKHAKLLTLPTYLALLSHPSAGSSVALYLILFIINWHTKLVNELLVLWNCSRKLIEPEEVVGIASL